MNFIIVPCNILILDNSLVTNTSRISGMEWWNGTLEWNTGIKILMPKAFYCLKLFNLMFRDPGAQTFLLKMKCDESVLKKVTCNTQYVTV